MRSTKVDDAFFRNYCKDIFGPGYEAPKTLKTNIIYGGTSITDGRIIFVNSIEDPW